MVKVKLGPKTKRRAGKVLTKIKTKFPKYRSSKGSAFLDSVEMAKKARIKRTDAVLDPFGGAGFSSTVLGYWKPKQIIALDVLYGNKSQPSPRDVERFTAKQEKKKKRTKIDSIAVDSKAIPLQSSSIDKIVSSPPYNLKLRNRKKQEAILEKFVPEMKRVLKKNGLVVLKIPFFWQLEFMAFHGFELVEEKKLNSLNKVSVFRLAKK